MPFSAMWLLRMVTLCPTGPKGTPRLPTKMPAPAVSAPLKVSSQPRIRAEQSPPSGPSTTATPPP